MNELYHHGIKGQRWGVRRYQNADGTLTEAGKRLMRNKGEKEEATAFDEKTGKLKSVGDVGRAHEKIHKRVAEDNRNLSNALNNASGISSRLSKMAADKEKKKRDEKIRKMDFSDYTDKELRDYVNRKQLERQVASITAEEEAAGGRSMSETLTTVGEVVAIGASVAAIAAAIHEIKK